MASERTNLLATAISAMSAEGESAEDIASALGLEEATVRVARGELSDEDMIKRMRSIVVELAEAPVEAVGGATKLKAAQWMHDELKGRNDVKAGITVNIGDLNIAEMNSALRLARQRAFEGLTLIDVSGEKQAAHLAAETINAVA
jgi:hypothetical protein